MDAEDSLLGVGPKGVLLGTGLVTPFYSPTNFELLRNTGLETIAWRSIAALGGASGSGEALADDKVVWRGYNSFTYPSASRDGAAVVLVEDLYGWARALTLVTQGAKPERLRVEAKRKLSSPKVSPGGKAVAYVDRACRRCAGEVAVLDLVSRKELWRLSEEDASAIGDFGWLDDQRLMVVFRAAAPVGDEPSSTALWGVDIRDGRRFTLMVGNDGAVFGQPAANAEAKLVVAAHYDGSAIVSLDLATNELRSHDVGGRPSSLALSPDADRVVFELVTRESPYPEIALLDLASSRVTRVSNNQSEDRYPLFSADGKRIFFEARNADPVFRRKRTVARIASVAAP
jgi:hypothetical protein